jgi:hypothetical protein
MPGILSALGTIIATAVYFEATTETIYGQDLLSLFPLGARYPLYLFCAVLVAIGVGFFSGLVLGFILALGGRRRGRNARAFTDERYFLVPGGFEIQTDEDLQTLIADAANATREPLPEPGDKDKDDDVLVTKDPKAAPEGTAPPATVVKDNSEGRGAVKT